MSTTTTRAMSGITDRKQAIALADGLADLFEERYIVLEYDGIPQTEYDVEPAKFDDQPNVTPFVIYVTGKT